MKSNKACACGCGHMTGVVQSGSYGKLRKGDAMEWCVGHRRAFFSYMPVPETGCWIWLGTPNSTGYGQHVRQYERYRGPVPAGLELDHLCRVRLCGNPWHLEAVTKSENLTRVLGEIEHGTRRMYERLCRCQACRDTHNARMRRQRARRKGLSHV